MSKVTTTTCFFLGASPMKYFKLKVINGSFIIYRIYSDTAYKRKTLLPAKIVGDSKHYPPANKEWKDSIYTYDKYFLRALPVKDDMARKAIRHYFHLSNCKDLARSRRMRSLIRRSTLERLFISRPEIKQTSDKSVITIYTFDRERQAFLKKIYFDIRKLELIKKNKELYDSKLFNTYDNWRRKFSLKNFLIKLKNKVYMLNKHSYSGAKYNYLLSTSGNSLFESRKYFLKSEVNLSRLKKKRSKLFNRSTVKSEIKKNISYWGVNQDNETRLLRHLAKFKEDNIQTRKLIHYTYLKRMLSMLGIQVLTFEEMAIDAINAKKDVEALEFYFDNNMLRHDGKILFLMKEINKLEILSTNHIKKDLAYIDKIIILMSNYLDKILNQQHVLSQKLSSFFINYSRENFRELLSNSYLSSNSPGKIKALNPELDLFKKELSLISNYINLKINRLKFSNYLPMLKLTLNKIYNKKLDINIVSLKYLHLNTDIFTEAIATKLKKKLGINVLNKSLRLVKIPYEYNDRVDYYALNRIRNLNIYKSLELINLQKRNHKNNSVDNLQSVLKKLYPRSFDNSSILTSHLLTVDRGQSIEEKMSTKVINILNSIRYKWVSGVRLEAAGRLTRRYTASRSASKFEYKGSLRDIDYSRKLDFLNKSVPVIKVRNQVKSNSQYSFAKSKKRIGAFGIKGWISSY